jgi:hypothetical protein
MNTSTSITTASVAQSAVVTSDAGTSRSEPTSDRAAPAPSAPQSSATVTLSPAAQAAQEASETPEETAREAHGNDHQAQQLVAKQAALARMYAMH